MRRAARVDNNQKEIVAAYRNLGATVECTHMVGGDFPDIVVGIANFTDLVEIKQPKGKLSEGQKNFIEEWRGSKPLVVRTVDDVVRHVKVRRQMAAKMGML